MLMSQRQSTQDTRCATLCTRLREMCIKKTFNSRYDFNFLVTIMMYAFTTGRFSTLSNESRTTIVPSNRPK